MCDRVKDCDNANVNGTDACLEHAQPVDEDKRKTFGTGL